MRTWFLPPPFEVSPSTSSVEEVVVFFYPLWFNWPPPYLFTPHPTLRLWFTRCPHSFFLATDLVLSCFSSRCRQGSFARNLDSEAWSLPSSILPARFGSMKPGSLLLLRQALPAVFFSPPNSEISQAFPSAILRKNATDDVLFFQKRRGNVLRAPPWKPLLIFFP